MAPASPTKSRKGKERATDIENAYDDLFPTITYRQLHSQNQGVRDPLRVIALCDSDAFYAACEMLRLGVTDKPLVVVQWGAMIAVNYPARKFGISRMQKVKDAKVRCPELMVVHVATYREGDKEPGYWDNIDARTHKVSLDFYRRESAKIHAMFQDLLPDAEIEKASIDEAFIDFTKPVRKLLLERYPYLAEVPEDSPDTPLPPPPAVQWEGLGHIIRDESTSSTSSTDDFTTWHDVALAIAAELMHSAREEIRTKLGYTLSAGIARNKFLAKLSASYRKPNSQSILRNVAIPSYLKPMEFQKIRFLGGKLGDALAKEYDVSKVEDLLSISLDDMQQKFGEGAIWVYEILRGIDRSEVKAKSIVNKSMLASKNLPQPITKAGEGYHWIRVLSAELALRLKDAREANPNLWPKTIVLHARKGYDVSRSKQAAFAFNRDFDVDYIASAGDKLWRELVGNSSVMEVTNVQLAFTGIETVESGLQRIEGFFKNSSKRPREGDQVEAADQTSYTCSRCGKEFELSSPSSGDDVDSDGALAVLRMEHDDWHFAKDLAGQPDDQTPPRQPAKKKKRKKDVEGIEKFFTRR